VYYVLLLYTKTLCRICCVFHVILSCYSVLIERKLDESRAHASGGGFPQAIRVEQNLNITRHDTFRGGLWKFSDFYLPIFCSQGLSHFAENTPPLLQNNNVFFSISITQKPHNAAVYINYHHHIANYYFGFYLYFYAK